MEKAMKDSFWTGKGMGLELIEVLMDNLFTMENGNRISLLHPCDFNDYFNLIKVKISGIYFISSF